MPDDNQLRLAQAIEVLDHLGLPRAQRNDRSAYTLLALLDLPPDRPWAQAQNPPVGVHAMMEWIDDHFGHRYAENSRESIRRSTLHQFEQAAVVVRNPDDPARAVNSPKNVYQLDGAVLELLRTYGSPSWPAKLQAYLTDVETLRARYAQARERNVLPVEVAPGLVVALTRGGQNPLIKQIAEEFIPQFIRGPRILYIGDAGAKTGHFDVAALEALGLVFDTHGPMPDLIVHDGERDWLVLVEAVTSHGPVSPSRMLELKELFAEARPGLVFVTAFPDRRTFGKHLPEIAWETEVWIAEDPTHMIHFDGERFLGPYGESHG
ncbi:MAG TPA: BsuBI/PstI family type II restriction endonuclease [Longimicrobium sp.]|nr:BsuBI/PstI family type II restriction endonuclease [Longimicrobium sp.]